MSASSWCRQHTKDRLAAGWSRPLSLIILARPSTPRQKPAGHSPFLHLLWFARLPRRPRGRCSTHSTMFPALVQCAGYCACAAAAGCRSTMAAKPAAGTRIPRRCGAVRLRRHAARCASARLAASRSQLAVAVRDVDHRPRFLAVSSLCQSLRPRSIRSGRCLSLASSRYPPSDCPDAAEATSQHTSGHLGSVRSSQQVVDTLGFGSAFRELVHVGSYSHTFSSIQLTPWPLPHTSECRNGSTSTSPFPATA